MVDRTFSDRFSSGPPPPMRWVAACAIGLALSVAAFSASTWATSLVERAAQGLAVERVRRNLAAQLGDETVSTRTAELFLAALPSDVDELKTIDTNRLRALARASAVRESSALSDGRDVYSALSEPEELGAQEGLARTTSNWDRRGNELVLELRYASAVCATLFGLACVLFWTPMSRAAGFLRGAKIAACGSALIWFGCATCWYSSGGASRGYGISAIGAIAIVVLISVFDAAFNRSRAARAALNLSRFCPRANLCKHLYMRGLASPL